MHEILKVHLEDFLSSRLRSESRGDLEAHLSQCSSCRETLEEARQSSLLLKLLASPTGEGDAPEPAPGFYVKVRQSIEAAHAPARWWFLWPALRQVAVALVMLVTLLGGYYFSLRASDWGSTAQLLLDMPVEREAPAALAVHRHSNPAGMCQQCWQAGSTAVADLHDQREQVMAALVEAGD